MYVPGGPEASSSPSNSTNPAWRGGGMEEASDGDGTGGSYSPPGRRSANRGPARPGDPRGPGESLTASPTCHRGPRGSPWPEGVSLWPEGDCIASPSKGSGP